MNKIGRKAKPGAPAGNSSGSGAAKSAAVDTYKPSTEKSNSGPGGFSEQDIEFMKKAI